MISTHQTTENNPGNQESKNLTLEEMDVLCRKFHQLHDEEILLTIERFFKMMKKFFSQKELRHHTSPSK